MSSSAGAEMIKKERTFPEGLVAAGVIILVSMITYLPQVGAMGFYHDDWFPVAARLTNTSLYEMFSIDRPFVGQIYALTYSLLGDNPLLWQLFAFGARLAGGLAFFWLLRMLWPEKRLFTMMAALLFMVYPGFLQQYNASTFQNHFVGFTLGIFSLALTVRALKCSSMIEKVPLATVAAGLIVVYLRIYEYMIGLEAVRILLIGYILIQRRNQRGKFGQLPPEHLNYPYTYLRKDFAPVPHKARRFWSLIKQLCLLWLPYLAGLGVFLYWRFVRFNSVRNATDVGLLLQKYADDPMRMAARLVFETFRDLLETVLFSWFTPAYQLISRVRYADLADSIICAAAAVVILWLFLRWLRKHYRSEYYTEIAAYDRWGLQVLWLGALITLVTLLPVLLSDRDVQFSTNLDKYTLQSSFGVALFWIGVICLLFPANLRAWVPFFLVGISVLTHYNNASFFRDYWENQRQVWWQLSWRAPDIRKDTVMVVMFPREQRVSEDFEVWVPVKAIYQLQPGKPAVTAEVLNNDTVWQILGEETSKKDFRTIQYERDFRNTLVLSYPSRISCLHVLDGRKARTELPLSEDPLVAQVAEKSDLGRIITDATPKTPPAIIFGKEPPTVSWCYFYQKASLARQVGDWQAVANLGDEAAHAGMEATDPSEWLPFVEGYAKVDRLRDAKRLLADVRLNPTLRRQICLDLVDYPPGSVTADAYLSLLKTTLCQ